MHEIVKSIFSCKIRNLLSWDEGRHNTHLHLSWAHSNRIHSRLEIWKRINNSPSPKEILEIELFEKDATTKYWIELNWIVHIAADAFKVHSPGRWKEVVFRMQWNRCNGYQGLPTPLQGNSEILQKLGHEHRAANSHASGGERGSQQCPRGWERCKLPLSLLCFFLLFAHFFSLMFYF